MSIRVNEVTDSGRWSMRLRVGAPRKVAKQRESSSADARKTKLLARQVGNRNSVLIAITVVHFIESGGRKLQ